LVGPSALVGRAFGPSLSGARSATRLQNIQSEIPTKSTFSGDPKKWRQFLDFQGSAKGIFRETRKSTLLENPISKPFLKIEKLKFCRHFCLHRIHELNQNYYKKIL
jgi:hypothetical protein